MVPVSIFSIETGPDWTLRRGLFKHSFSMQSLQKFKHTLRSLSMKLSQKLTEEVREKELPSVAGTALVEIDELFAKLTMDSICSLAFGFKLNALDDSQLFKVAENVKSIYVYIYIIHVH